MLAIKLQRATKSLQSAVLNLPNRMPSIVPGQGCESVLVKMRVSRSNGAYGPAPASDTKLTSQCRSLTASEGTVSVSMQEPETRGRTARQLETAESWLEGKRRGGIGTGAGHLLGAALVSSASQVIKFILTSFRTGVPAPCTWHDLACRRAARTRVCQTVLPIVEQVCRCRPICSRVLRQSGLI